MDEREIRWMGSSYSDILAFPSDARRQAGFQLGRVQAGLDPEDWKPFGQVGAGTQEIRIRADDGAFRILYLARFEEAIYVLHCFQKKTQATTQQDKQLAQIRYKAVLALRQEEAQ